MPPYVAQVPTATTAVAFGVSRSSHSLVVIGCAVPGLLPKPDQYPSSWSFSLGIDPSTTRTNGSSSPRSALKNHSRKSSAPPLGPHSKSISGQWTATRGRPGSAPSAISSMLGWVAPVRATESPSQLSPALIHSTWIRASSAASSASRVGAYGITATFRGHLLEPVGVRTPVVRRDRISVYLRGTRCDYAHVRRAVKRCVAAQGVVACSVRSHSHHAAIPSPLVTERGSTRTPALTDRQCPASRSSRTST